MVDGPGANTPSTAVNGVFWLPQDQDTTVSGRLILAEGAAPRLELAGSLTEPYRIIRKEELDDGSVIVESRPANEGPEHESLVVRGILHQSPKFVTLLDCFTNHRLEHVGGRGGSEQHLQASYVLRGHGYVGGADAVFDAVRVRVQNLDDWVGLPGFKLTHDRQAGTTGLEYERQEVAPVGLSGRGYLSLSEKVQWSQVQATGGSIQREAWLMVSELAGHSWMEIDRRIVSPLVALVGLSTGEKCPLTRVQVMTQSGDWLEILAGWPSEQPASRLRASGFLTTFNDLTLIGVAAWLNKVETMGPVPPVVAAAGSGSQLHLETQLLELLTVAEGLHARLFPDERRMDPATANQIRRVVNAALKDQSERHRRVVTSMLSFLEEPSYPMRLRQLATAVEAVVPGATGHIPKWVQLAARARNDFAHRRISFLNDATIKEYVTLLYSLRWVLGGLLLLQTGVTAERLAARFAEYAPYRHFVDRAQRDVPEIYGPREPTTGTS